MFSDSDLKQISAHQLAIEGINYQIEKFRSGFPPTKLYDAPKDGSGILMLSDAEADKHANYYESHLGGYEIVKFVPASGAASRMFKTLFGFINEYDESDAAYEKMKSDQNAGSVFTFFKEIEKFAFYNDLKEAYLQEAGSSLEEDQLKRKYGKILKVLLEEKGLDYGSLPKGLLKFHRYGDDSRTPVEEHMVEGAQYAQDAEGNVQLHFTVSPDHQEKFEKHVSQVKATYESKFKVKIQVTYSIQKPSTDTIAVDMDNQPFRNEDGSILFRPAGHGALLENLNDIDADIVFIKNIDNVVPDNLKAETTRYKKVIAGILIHTAQRVAEAVKDLENGNGIAEAKALLENELGYKPGPQFDALSDQAKQAFLKDKLCRPIRVCGMVKAEGDPGGGPFWVKGEDGSLSLQIVETAQIDLKDSEQKDVFGKATHFNPADVACFLKNVDGITFDLMKYRDPETGFITQKSQGGKDLKAQELPGLWNGSMADWNTIFVDVPAITFNPVKSVNDLLKKEHQG